MSEFKALIATREGDKFGASIQKLPREALPSGNVLVRVAYSSLNYKDGLAVTGQPGLIRKFPMVPGIDLAGTVEESSSPAFHPGDSVLVTGSNCGESIWGGYSQLARLDSAVLVPLPKAFSLQQAMAIGTAGFTAMQCVMALEAHGLQPYGKDVLVTGATGGVGSIAVAILAKRGYRVVASTGRPELGDYLRSLGASEIIDRNTLSNSNEKGLGKIRWGGCVECVGGPTLAGILPAMTENSSVASCGLAGGAYFSTSVYPFILRGVNLLGINSVHVPPSHRRQIWKRLTQDLSLPLLGGMTRIEPLEKIFELSKDILAGRIRGRVVIDVNQ